MILDALHRIANHRESLSREEARAVMTEILGGKCTDAQIAGLLVALHMKGETVEEIVGFAEAIRAAAAPLPARQNSTVDVSDTGARRPGRYLRHGRRCQRHLQHFNRHRIRGCGRGRARGQARQPQHQFKMRLGRCDGGAWRQHQSAA